MTQSDGNLQCPRYDSTAWQDYQGINNSRFSLTKRKLNNSISINRKKATVKKCSFRAQIGLVPFTVLLNLLLICSVLNQWVTWWSCCCLPVGFFFSFFGTDKKIQSKPKCITKKPDGNVLSTHWLVESSLPLSLATDFLEMITLRCCSQRIPSGPILPLHTIIISDCDERDFNMAM